MEGFRWVQRKGKPAQTINIDRSRSVKINLIDHILGFLLGGSQTEGLHDGTEFVLGDDSCGGRDLNQLMFTPQAFKPYPDSC